MVQGVFLGNLNINIYLRSAAFQAGLELVSGYKEAVWHGERGMSLDFWKQLVMFCAP